MCRNKLTGILHSISAAHVLQACMLFTWIVLTPSTANYPNKLHTYSICSITSMFIYEIYEYVLRFSNPKSEHSHIGLSINKFDYLNTQQRDFLFKFNKNSLHYAITIKMLNLLLVNIRLGLAPIKGPCHSSTERSPEIFCCPECFR